MEKEKKKETLAAESLKTKKTREKLRKQIQIFDQKLTPYLLKQKNHEIYRWISCNASDRISLKGKNISLFDENQNTATLSQKVSDLATHLKETL